MIRDLTLALALPLALAAQLPLAGCHSCTEMWAPSVVTFTFDGADWAPGRWALEVNGHGEGALCVVDLPWSEGDLVSCSATAALSFDADGGVAVFTVTEFEPESFALWLTHDGEQVFETSFTPEYEVAEPNGNGCGESYYADFTVQAP